MSGVHIQSVDVGPAHKQASTCRCQPRLDIIEELDGQLAWAYVHRRLTQSETHTINITSTSDAFDAFSLAWGGYIKRKDA